MIHTNLVSCFKYSYIQNSKNQTNNQIEETCIWPGPRFKAAKG